MARSCFVPLIGVLAFGLVACGGDDLGRPSGARGTESLDPCLADDGYEFQNIVNFEPLVSGSDLAVCDSTVPCGFFSNYDDVQSPENPDKPLPRGAECLTPVDPDAVVFMRPDPKASNFRGTEIAEGRCDVATSGMHVVAENVGMCYGPDGRLGWGAALDLNFAPVLPGAEWDGIAVWVRNTSPVRVAINVALADKYTSGAEDPVTRVRYCSAEDPMPPDPPIPDAEKCDAFGTAVTLTEEWSFVPVRFASMRQKGFGVPSVNGALDTASISRLQILMSAGSWDFWIDDIALFRSVK